MGQTIVPDDGSAYVHFADSETPYPLQSARYVRITAEKAGLELYEIAFRDEDGSLIEVQNIVQENALADAMTDAAALIDEQDTVPEIPSYYNGTYFDEIYHARTAYELLHGLVHLRMDASAAWQGADDGGHTPLRHDALWLALHGRVDGRADAAADVPAGQAAHQIQQAVADCHAAARAGQHAFYADAYRHHRFLRCVLDHADVSVHDPLPANGLDGACRSGKR